MSFGETGGWDDGLMRGCVFRLVPMTSELLLGTSRLGFWCRGRGIFDTTIGKKNIAQGDFEIRSSSNMYHNHLYMHARQMHSLPAKPPPP